MVTHGGGHTTDGFGDPGLHAYGESTHGGTHTNGKMGRRQGLGGSEGGGGRSRGDIQEGRGEMECGWGKGAHVGVVTMADGGHELREVGGVPEHPGVMREGLAAVVRRSQTPPQRTAGRNGMVGGCPRSCLADVSGVLTPPHRVRVGRTPALPPGPV